MTETTHMPAQTPTSPGGDRRLAWLPLTIGAVLVGLLLFLIASGVMSWWGGRDRSAADADTPTPVEQLRALRAEEQRLLTSYGWVDRSAGLVRIPIERAMDVLIEEAGGEAQTP